MEPKLSSGRSLGSLVDSKCLQGAQETPKALKMEPKRPQNRDPKCPKIEPWHLQELPKMSARDPVHAQWSQQTPRKTAKQTVRQTRLHDRPTSRQTIPFFCLICLRFLTFTTLYVRALAYTPRHVSSFDVIAKRMMPNSSPSCPQNQ